MNEERTDQERHIGESQPDREWHILTGGIPEGPFPETELAARLANGTINGETLAWADGLESWKPVSELGFAAVVARAPPPVLQTNSVPTDDVSAPSAMNAAALGALSAASVSLVESSGIEIARIFYGTVFALLVGGYFFRHGLMGMKTWLWFLLCSTVAYSIARSLAFQMFMNSPNDVQIAMVVGGTASTIGAAIVLISMMFAKQRWLATVSGVAFSLALPIAIGAVVMHLAISNDLPESGSWPRDKSWLFLIHVPWQSAFAFGLAMSYRELQGSR